MTTASTSKFLGRSPLHHRLTAGGATFLETAGWLVAQHFGDAKREAAAAGSAVGLCDLSHTAKWQLHGADLASALSTVLDGEVLKAGRVIPCRSSYICCPSREEALVICEPADATIISKLSEVGRDGCLHLVDRTSGFARLLLCGPQSRPLLRKLTPLDVREKAFADFRCVWTPMAGIRILLIRADRQQLPAYEILASREYSDYVWEVLRDAGREYDLLLFGLEAAHLLRTTS
jgi:heterotetrameric sarcosine oxidase gamma subunit